MNKHKEHVYVIGAGGHAKVVISTIRSMQLFSIAGILDDDESRWNREIMNEKILGPIDLLDGLKNPSAILAIGDNATRASIAKRFSRVKWQVIIHPSAWIDPTVAIGEGTVIFAGSVVQPETIIGKHCIVNTAVSIDHDCYIEDCVHIAPGTNLAGSVNIGKGTFLGTGTRVIPNTSIGQWAYLGAGTVVVKDLPDRIMAFGIPARIQRYLGAN